MDPEAILDDLTKLSLKKRYKESLVEDLSISSFDDLDNYVRDFQIDDSISECFVSDTEPTSRHVKPGEAIIPERRHTKNSGKSRKHISDLFKRKSKDITKSHHVKEPTHHAEKENIYCEMKSCIPKTALFHSVPSQDILNEDISEEDDYVLPTQYQPFERISNLIRHNSLIELELELTKYTWDVLISSESGNNILHQCVLENRPKCAEIVVSCLPELLFMRNRHGLIPPQLAIQNNKVKCLEVMMSSISHHDQYVVLMAEEAIKSDKVQCFQVIIENCNDMEEAVLHRVTQLAAKHGNISCLQILIEYGVNVWSADNNGQTILEIARDNNNQHCSHYLLILQLSQTLLYSYINTQVFYQRRETHLSRLEELIKQLKSRTDKEKPCNKTKLGLDELSELKEELNGIICQSNKIEASFSKHDQSLFHQPAYTENTRIFSQIVKLLKDKTSEQINGILSRIFNGKTSLVESENEDIPPHDTTVRQDYVALKKEVTLLSDPANFVSGNSKAQRDSKCFKHQGTQNPDHFIDGTFPENESKRMNFPLASNLTTNSLREDGICVLPSRLILPYVACKSDNNDISLESRSKKLNYTSLNGGSSNEPRKFNQINEEVQNVDLRDSELHKHLQAVTKRENDLVEKIVPANRLLKYHQAKQTADTASTDKHSTLNHHKPMLMLSRNLFRTNSAPDEQISKLQFTENSNRKPHLKYKSNSTKKIPENKSWKPWYEISDDEKSLQHDQRSDTFSDASSRPESYM